MVMCGDLYRGINVKTHLATWYLCPFQYTIMINPCPLIHVSTCNPYNRIVHRRGNVETGPAIYGSEKNGRQIVGNLFTGVDGVSCKEMYQETAVPITGGSMFERLNVESSRQSLL